MAGVEEGSSWGAHVPILTSTQSPPRHSPGHPNSFAASSTEPWERPRLGGGVVFSHPAACSRPLCRCGVDAHPHARLCGHRDWLCLQPGPVPPGRPGLCCAPLAPPAAAGLCTFFCLLHLLLVRGAWGGRLCHRSPEGCKRQNISQSWAHTLPHRVSHNQKAKPSPSHHVTDAETKAVGRRFCQVIQFSGFPGPPACLLCTHCLAPKSWASGLGNGSSQSRTLPCDHREGFGKTFWAPNLK